MSGALALYAPEALSRTATAADIRAQVNLIQEVMRAVMKDGTHYGTIPGTQKPTLYKPGSEKILSTFHIAIEPIVTDLSTPDEARFRVETRATTQAGGAYLGSGIGEASSAEEKYKWRASVCREEWDATAEDRRRAVWKKGTDKPYQILQVRTNHADVANTVLKMAKKRSQIDVTLTVTAASDVFAQDIEDLPDGVREAVAADEAPAKPPSPPRRPDPPADGPRSGEPVISEAQAKRCFAIAMGAGWTADELQRWLKSEYGLASDRDIPRRLYDQIVQAIQGAAGH